MKAGNSKDFIDELGKYPDLALLDLNDLYLPYSEMTDEDHRVSPQEQLLNQQFYGMK